MNDDAYMVCRELSFDVSEDAAHLAIKAPSDGWYVWPEHLSCVEAMMAGALYGPFKSKKHAEKVGGGKLKD